MEYPKATSEQVALAAADVLRNEALQKAELVFGNVRVTLTKGGTIRGADPVDTDALADYPAVETNLVDDTDSWLS